MDKSADPAPVPHKKFIDFLSGLIAGLISVLVCNPLDIARTRLNVLVVMIRRRLHRRTMGPMASTPIFRTR